MPECLVLIAPTAVSATGRKSPAAAAAVIGDGQIVAHRCIGAREQREAVVSQLATVAHVD